MEAAFSGVVSSGPQLCNTGKDQALMLWRMLLAGCLRVFKMFVVLVSLNIFCTFMCCRVCPEPLSTLLSHLGVYSYGHARSIPQLCILVDTGLVRLP